MNSESKVDDDSKSRVDNKGEEQINEPKEQTVVLLSQTGAEPRTMMIELLYAIITHFAVRSPHWSVELTRITKLKLQLSSSENNVEKLSTLLFSDFKGNLAILLGLLIYYSLL